MLLAGVCLVVAGCGQKPKTPASNQVLEETPKTTNPAAPAFSEKPGQIVINPTQENYSGIDPNAPTFSGTINWDYPSVPMRGYNENQDGSGPWQHIQNFSLRGYSLKFFKISSKIKILSFYFLEKKTF